MICPLKALKNVHMKKMILLFSVFCMMLAADAQNQLNVMTFNIRLNHAGDSLNAWPHRKDMVASQILFHEAHLVGVQEALHMQMEDLQQRLTGYKFAGVGRKDGKQGGEYSAIFYDTSRLALIKTETFWLAEQTNIPGLKGWDAAIERVVTWAQFRDMKTNKTFYHFNTHFDHVGKIARKESARLILDKINEIAKDQPVILTGDLLTDINNPKQVIQSEAISETPHYGPTGTFTGFQSKETSNEPIDYIFIKNGIKVLKHATLSQTWQGKFSSDHFPVLAVVEIK